MSIPPEPLLTVRAAVVLLSTLLVGLLTGGISYLATPNIPAAFLVGGGGVAVALPLLHTVLARN